MTKRVLAVPMMGILWLAAVASAVLAGQEDIATLERQFRELPMESRRLIGPLFWLHGDDSRQRLELFVDKVAEGGNGCFIVEPRPHNDWLGPGWYRDFTTCLDAAKQRDLKMWIFDAGHFPSQLIGDKESFRYAAKRLDASAVDVEGPRVWEADGYVGQCYVAALAGRLSADGTIQGDSLVDLAPHIHNGKLTWPVPAGTWKIMKFTHVQGPPAGPHGELTVDGASKHCVDWYLQTSLQPHFDHFKADFGKTISGFFYDEPVTRGDWGTELNDVLARHNVDWKKAYAAYKFQLAGDEQIAAKYQYLDAFAEAWGRTMYGGMADWCRARGVKSIGHFQDHNGFYHSREHCAGDLMRLQGYSDMGGIDVIARHLVMGQRATSDYSNSQWELARIAPKLGSSVSHVYGKPDDVTLAEVFGARGQDLTYSEMKWWTDYLQVSGVNFMIPHSFNPRAPYDTDCPPYFYMDQYEPRWPLYRVYADYTSRLSLMLTGGRHVCPVALLHMGQSLQVGRAGTPEDMTAALQDALVDCDWLPYEVFEKDSRLVGKQVELHQEQYRVLIIPPVEVVPFSVLKKAQEFFEAGGVVVGYGFLPSKSATIGHDGNDITAICDAIWGQDAAPGLNRCRTSAADGQSYFLPEKPTAQELRRFLADAGISPTLEVLEGESNNWLHVLHRVKAGHDVFLVCNQNHKGAARQFRFRAKATGEPECWDAMRNEIAAIPFQRIGGNSVEFSLHMEPLETVLIVFQPKRQSRPLRIETGVEAIREPILLARDPNPPAPKLSPLDANRSKTVSPVVAADPFRGHFTIPNDVDVATCRVCLEMEGLPDDSAAVTVNGVRAGGIIGRPLRLDITRHLKSGQNAILVEPLGPQTARITFFGMDWRQQ